MERLAINFATVANLHYQHNQLQILYLVNNSVVTNSHAVKPSFAL